ncbi:RagB/SusD family nutrient uptake outer membrane protein [Chitinophaga silvatica]|uniref:RagB/SusD family nutrient uptake outer membrane protein n=1 Tax=Chitinophaga silvatica TaxID=2282649 RepID=A0A3E1Y8N8_9BACT|nr:RagB/SusD family nutrient uptake outer membrane protein [Chitinophaga silvatica]RFS21809.1 RagB/SusD family nutrient uptake outer membrane protein [Chitinophaga silvatica]
MKKIFITTFSLAAFILFSGSCSKSFLNEKPYSSYTPVTLNDSLGFEASLVGIYNHISTIFSWSDQQGWPSVWQVGTDVANATANQQGIEIPYYNYAQLTSTDGAAARIWNRYYILANLTNTIIDGVESPTLTSISDAGKKAIDAEAKFFRAYAYNNLATLFGKVPLVLHPLTGPKTDFTRASLDEVNNAIISDLTFAITNLPDIDAVKSNSKGKMYGRANKYMAMQLLAEVYLRAGKGALAEEQATNIIKSGRFSLINKRYGAKSNLPGDYYSDMFQYGNQRRSQGNTEAIWVLEQENPATVVGGITDNPQQRRVWGAAYYNISGMVICDSLGGRGIGRLRLSNWVLYHLYDHGDIRNSEYNIRRQYYYNDPTKPTLFGKPVPFTDPDSLYKICPSTTKWGQFDPNDTFGYAMIKDFMLMRLGETYLLLAEALVAQGKTQEAADAINVLRTRAQAPDVKAGQMTLDFILDERARELIGEENRRATLMRTGTLVDRAIKLNSGDAQKPITGLTATNLLLPIPLSEIQLNKDAVLDQNPNYK